jgi:2-oxoglutarate ferredoxin oxidoreductase subunit gamma
VKTKRLEIRFCGFGGQGVVLAGQIFGRVLAYSGFNVVQTQSYGAETRGGKAKSEIVVSTEPIGFPMVRHCDVLIAMNQDSLDTYIDDLKKEHGVLLVDEDLVKKMPDLSGVKVVKIPANRLAKENFDSTMFTNIIMVGVLAKILKKTIKLDINALERAVRDSVPKKFIEENLKALKIGFNCAV